MCYSATALGNPLVDLLSDTARDQLQPLQSPQGAVLFEAGERPRHAYFPVGSIVSMLHAMEDGSAAEVAIIGREGMVGMELFYGIEQAPARAVVQTGGPAYQLRGDLFKLELERNPRLNPVLLRCAHTLMTQMAQTAACNRHHTVIQQLCRWLLTSQDRASTSQIFVTQEMIANLLGVRREGVTEAACKLQRAGLIAYSRGRITVLDRKSLEGLACECYDVMRKASERLLVSQPRHETPHLPRETAAVARFLPRPASNADYSLTA
jgi:CRP-like cAMP-binding protein